MGCNPCSGASIRKALGAFTLVCVMTCCFPARALAQTVISYGTWSNQGAPAAYATQTLTGGATGNNIVATPDPDLLRIGLMGTAPAPNGSFTLTVGSSDTFTLNAQANVSLPTYLFGSIDLGFPGNSVSTVTASVVVTTAAGVATGLAFNESQTYNAGNLEPGIISLSDFGDPSKILGLGAYSAKATFTITGQVNNSTNAVVSDFLSNTADGIPGGLVTSVEASPTGLPDSRAVIGAPAARTAYGVNGSGIKVGLLENGNPFLNTSALNGRVQDLYPAGGSTQYPSEHALATAGILAGADANSSNAGIAPGAQIISASYLAYKARSNAKQMASDLAAQGVNVINMSFGGADITATSTNQLVNAYPNLTYVEAAGNSGRKGAGSVSAAMLAYNAIAVGDMNNSINSVHPDSSYGAAAGTPMKPDLMAPGSYINAPSAQDLNGNGKLDDFSTTFTGASYQTGNVPPITGEVSGTSFAAPAVSGTVALLDQFATKYASCSAQS